MTNSKLFSSIFFLFFFFTAFASSTSLSDNIHKCPKQQSEALLLFKHSFSSFNSTNDNCISNGFYSSDGPLMMSWNTSRDCCNWDGVTCDDSTGDVIKLDVSCGLLEGTIHPNSSLFNHLPRLTDFDLSSNKLNGRLPSWLFTSPSLQNLRFYDNMLSGIVPFDSFALPSLKLLDLSYNQLDGDIPSDISINLTHLTYLTLSFNRLNGALPSWLFTPPSLQYLDLSYNMFSGKVPFESFALPSLEELDLYNNQLDGDIPSDVSINLTHLTSLDLSRNRLNGTLPSWLFTSPSLEYLRLYDNMFSGIVPFDSFALPSLNFLDLSYNQLDGQIEGPPSICNMSNLKYLDMSNNRFGGSIPQCFGNITSSLLMINMGNNSFQGPIPTIYDNCELLKGLILKGNQLEGEVPSSLSKCQSLKVVDFGNNHLNGTFPGWLGDLPNLQALVLKSNNFHGHIQPSATVDSPFPSLRVLDLSHNRFVGRLPEKYFLNFNSMKNVVKNSTKPEYLKIGGEYYSFVVAVKGVDQDFPQIFVDYTIIDLSQNTFEGQIPKAIGGLNSLIVLNLSHNCLGGPIPHALGNLTEIESLDLSWNQLSGEIPQSLARITTLAVLNLSQNLLVGRIPEGPQFSTFGTSFGGNSGLYGSPLPKREHQSSPKVEDDGGYDDEEDSGFTWKVVMLGYGCGTLVGLVMGYLMLSTRKVKWFNAIADAAQSLVLKKK